MLQRCDIHYLTPDLRIIPFCSFNVIPEWYRDKIQQKYGMPIEAWEARQARSWRTTSTEGPSGAAATRRAADAPSARKKVHTFSQSREPDPSVKARLSLFFKLYLSK